MKWDKILTPEFLKVHYIDAQKSAKQIADEVKCSKHTVLVYLNNANITRRSCIKDLEGQRFNKLLVTKNIGRDKFGRVKWECLCDCGKTTIVDSTNLIEGITSSCGCLKNLHNKDNKKWKGCGDLSSTQWTQIKNNAKTRGISFTISIEEAWELYLKQNKKCIFTGLDIDFNIKHSNYNGSASLDRIDSANGYITGNIQWVHKYINIMKWSLSTKEFIDICKLVVKKDLEL
jgi:hypothetical protein